MTRFVAALALVAATTSAFTPAPLNNNRVVATQLQFGFLKELGLEKPSWLPDFGGEKKEEVAVAEDVDAAVEGEEAAEPEGEATP